jgi:hypothetical protein
MLLKRLHRFISLCSFTPAMGSLALMNLRLLPLRGTQGVTSLGGFNPRDYEYEAGRDCNKARERALVLRCFHLQSMRIEHIATW